MLIIQTKNLFLTLSNSLSNEYPDAAEFKNMGQAKKALKRVNVSGTFEVIENYGMDNQAVVYSEEK